MGKDYATIALLKKYNSSTVCQSMIMWMKDRTYEIKLFFMSLYLAVKAIC
jgi:hypothetical protein